MTKIISEEEFVKIIGKHIGVIDDDYKRLKCDIEKISLSLNSLQYMELIVTIESELSIEIPDYFLAINCFQSIDRLYLIVRDILEGGEIHEETKKS
jgi:acyl carrier protein